LVIAIRDLVGFIGATNAAHIVLVTHYRDWSELPVVLGTDGKALIRRLAQRLSKIAAGQWSESDGRRLPKSEVAHRSFPHWRSGGGRGLLGDVQPVQSPPPASRSATCEALSRRPRRQ
jgi:hypothetical protein